MRKFIATVAAIILVIGSFAGVVRAEGSVSPDSGAVVSMQPTDTMMDTFAPVASVADSLPASPPIALSTVQSTPSASPVSDITPTDQPTDTPTAGMVATPAPGNIPSPLPTASLRLETGGCTSSLIVDYVDFGPTDFLVGYVQVNSQPGSGFYVAPGAGTGSVKVVGQLSGTITADVTVDPFLADTALLASFAVVPPGYNPEWFRTPYTWPLSCAAPIPTTAPTPTITALSSAVPLSAPAATPIPTVEPTAEPTPVPTPQMIETGTLGNWSGNGPAVITVPGTKWVAVSVSWACTTSTTVAFEPFLSSSGSGPTSGSLGPLLTSLPPFGPVTITGGDDCAWRLAVS